MEFLSNIFWWQEDDLTPSLDLQIPEEVFHRMSFSTQEKKLELWVDMLDISTQSDVYTDIIKTVIYEYLHVWLEESNNTVRSIDFSDLEFRIPIITESLRRLYSEAPTDFLFLSDTSPAIVIHWIALHGIWDFMADYDLDNIRRTYFWIIAEDLKHHWAMRTDTELERSYLNSQIWELGSVSAHIHLFSILREYGFIDDSRFVEEVRAYYDIWQLSYEEFVSLERSEGINHFELLRDTGFSSKMQSFLWSELFPVLLPDQDLNAQAIENIQRLCLFIIDIETTAWKNLINGVSTATSYTQTLNESASSREDRRYNSLDTRIRYAARFYNSRDFIVPTELQAIENSDDSSAQKKREAKIVIRDMMQTPWNINQENGEWVHQMWKYNEIGKNMLEFSFEDELRILLLYFNEREPDALRDIIVWKNTQRAAETLYDSHHSNAYGHVATNRRMKEILASYYW
jgi:hypothetical protein